MHNTHTSINIIDYCEQMLRKEIVVNKDYQRSSKIWPVPARSFLIESILLNYPIPKLYLHQVTDLKSRKTIKYIVDGQQRSYSILEFYQNEYAISRTSEIEEVKGKTFDQLPDDYKQNFISYPLSIDLFSSATDDEIREVFRRINSYTVPLNPEEKRHSEYQGDLKWFIYKLSKRYDPSLVNMGVFRDKQLIRMADAKLFSEITYSFLHGITTTTSPNLNKLYIENDDEFPQAKLVEERINYSMKTILEWPEIHNTALMRPHIFYALVLAITHLKKPVDVFLEKYKPAGHPKKRDTIITNLSSLADSLEDHENVSGKFNDFVLASTKTTNDVNRRTVIFKWLCKAIELEKI